MRKLKCIKCGLYFKDRLDPEDLPADKTLCYKCRFIWKVLKLTITALAIQTDRDIALHLIGLDIKKKNGH